MNDITINVNNTNRKNESYFDGELSQLIAYTVLGYFITIVTLGLCFPWAICMKINWKLKHTIIEGRRLKFDGKAMGLFGLWIKWWLLCVITFGIYSFWVGISLEKWIVKHTRFS